MPLVVTALTLNNKKQTKNHKPLLRKCHVVDNKISLDNEAEKLIKNI
jgi:hypothetical protein